MKKSTKLPVNYNGLTRSQHIKDLTKKQDGLCAICDEQFSFKRKRVVDHNHKNGDIRGLLCYSCNIGLGVFQDNCGLLYRAIVYLSKFQPTQKEWEDGESKINWWRQLPDMWTAN